MKNLYIHFKSSVEKIFQTNHIDIYDFQPQTNNEITFCGIPKDALKTKNDLENLTTKIKQDILETSQTIPRFALPLFRQKLLELENKYGVLVNFSTLTAPIPTENKITSVEKKPITNDNNVLTKNDNNIATNNNSTKSQANSNSNFSACINDTVLVEIALGDILKSQVQVVVNPANGTLEHNGGLAKEILRQVGPKFNEECEKWIIRHKKLKVGNAMATKAGNLKFSHIINTVGPRYPGNSSKDFLLVNAVMASLELCDKLNCTTIAIPAISAGIFGFPAKESAKCCIKGMYDYFNLNPQSKITYIRWMDLQQECVSSFISSLKYNLETNALPNQRVEPPKQVENQTVQPQPKGQLRFKTDAQWYWDQSEDSPKNKNWSWVAYPPQKNLEIEFGYVNNKKKIELKGNFSFFFFLKN